MILENKFEKYRGNERADRRIEEVLERRKAQEEDGQMDPRILVLPEFIPCQKFLSETDVEFVIFPSNRGGYCIQPLKKEYSMNYKCDFPKVWLGLENEELVQMTGLKSASFCHKGGFLMTVGELEDAKKACRISLEQYREEDVIVSLGGDADTDRLLAKLPDLQNVKIIHLPPAQMPELSVNGIYAEVLTEKAERKALWKEQLKQILKYKPEAVYVEGNAFETYPIVHLLRKKHIPVLTKMEYNGTCVVVRIPSGS